MISYVCLIIFVLVFLAFVPFSEGQYPSSPKCSGNQTCTAMGDMTLDIIAIKPDSNKIDFQVGSATLSSNNNFTGYIKVPGYGSGTNEMIMEPSGNGWYMGHITNRLFRNTNLAQVSNMWPYDSYNFRVILGLRSNTTFELSRDNLTPLFGGELANNNIWQLKSSTEDVSYSKQSEDDPRLTQRTYIVVIEHTGQYQARNFPVFFLLAVMIGAPAIHFIFYKSKLVTQATVLGIIFGGQIAVWAVVISVLQAEPKGDYFLPWILPLSASIYVVAAGLWMLIRRRRRSTTQNRAIAAPLPEQPRDQEIVEPVPDIPISISPSPPPVDELRNISASELALATDRVRDARNDMALRSAWAQLERLATSTRIWDHGDFWISRRTTAV